MKVAFTAGRPGVKKPVAKTAVKRRKQRAA